MPASTSTLARRTAARSTGGRTHLGPARCRYLMGLYYGTWPWLREFVNVNRLGLPAVKL